MLPQFTQDKNHCLQRISHDSNKAQKVLPLILNHSKNQQQDSTQSHVNDVLHCKRSINYNYEK